MGRHWLVGCYAGCRCQGSNQWPFSWWTTTLPPMATLFIARKCFWEKLQWFAYQQLLTKYQSDPYRTVQSLLIRVQRVYLLIVVGNSNPSYRSSVTAQEQKRDVTRSGHQVDQHSHADSTQSWQIQLLHQQSPEKDTQTGTGDGCHTWGQGEKTRVSSDFTGDCQLKSLCEWWQCCSVTFYTILMSWWVYSENRKLLCLD